MIQLQYIIFILFLSCSMQCAENKSAWGEDEKLVSKTRHQSNDALAQQDTTVLAKVVELVNGCRLVKLKGTYLAKLHKVNDG